MQCKIQIHTCSKYGHSYLTFTQSPLPEWIPCQAAMVTGIPYALNLIKCDPEILFANRAISDIRPGFKLKPQKNRHFPVTILSAIINGLCVACRILPGTNAPFSLRLSDSDVVQHSSSRELPRATASLGLNTCDPVEAVQLDLMWCHANEAPIEGMSQRRLTRACAVCVCGAAGYSTKGRSLMLGLSRATSVVLPERGFIGSRIACPGVGPAGIGNRYH